MCIRDSDDSANDFSNLNDTKVSNIFSETMINTIINPIKSYYDPYEQILTDSDVEHGVQNMFSLESIGIPSNDKHITSYDQDMVKQFIDNIIFKDGKYHVSLPWHQDKITQVPSNYHISLRVMDRVIQSLKAKNLLNEYNAVFQQQLQDNILEKIEVNPNQIHNLSLIHIS